MLLNYKQYYDYLIEYLNDSEFILSLTMRKNSIYIDLVGFYVFRKIQKFSVWLKYVPGDTETRMSLL